MKTSLSILAAALLLGHTSLAAKPAAESTPLERLQSGILLTQLYDNLSVSGTVTALNAEAGLVRLSTPAQGEITVQLRPEVFGQLKAGDAALVYVGYSVGERTIAKETCDEAPVQVPSC